MTAPRVLQVVLALDPGGTERLVVDLVRRLRSRFPTTVCCLDRAGTWGAGLRDDGVEVVALDRQPGVQLSLAPAIARLARRTGAAVMHCHHFSPFFYGRLAAILIPGVRVVFTEHGRLSDAPPSPKRRWMTRALSTGVQELYAVSHDLRRHLLAEGYPARMRVVWNGIDPGSPPDAGARRDARQALGVADGVPVAGLVGRLDSVKDIGTALDAVARVRAAGLPLVLAVIGQGTERAALESRAAALGMGDAVRFLGHREDARALLAGFDVYVNTSISEGVSLTILEAMAAARPVVATAVGGTPEVVVEGETGWLCPARDPGAVAAALARVLAAADGGRAAGEAGRARVLAHFTLDRMIDTYASVYARLGRRA